MPAEWPVEKIAWAAGFFDGEGCISAKTAYLKSRKSRGRILIANLSVSVVQREIEPLLEFQKMLGGVLRLNRNKTGFPIWVLEFYGEKAMLMLEVIQPHLIVKWAQADLALTMKDTFHQGIRLTQKEIQARQQWHAQMRKLKSPKAGVRPIVKYHLDDNGGQLPLIKDI